MSRTQDLAVARLRLLAARWGRGGSPAPLREDQVLGGRAVALTLAVVVAAGALLWGGLGLVRSTPRGAPTAGVDLAPSGRGVDPFASPTPSASPDVVVHVVGEVRRPGVVRLPAGARVVDAVAAAGGLRRGRHLGSTNLARVLVDGERIEVGALEPSGSAGSSGAGGSGASGGAGEPPAGPVDLNSATATQLDALPGVGPVTAEKILAWRAQHRRFATVDELAEVPGIGPKTLEDLRPHVRV